MSLTNNTDIDLYARWLPLIGTKEMDEARLPPGFTERLMRVKSVYDYWRRRPTLRTADIVTFSQQMFGLQRSQAYEDIRLVKLLLGDIEASTKEFWRWRINSITMDSITDARRARDFKTVASLLKILVDNNKTDKDDPLELSFDRIVPQQFDMSDDISIVNPGRKTTSRAKIMELLRKYGKTDAMKVEDADFTEVPADTAAPAPGEGGEP